MKFGGMYSFANVPKIWQTMLQWPTSTIKVLLNSIYTAHRCHIICDKMSQRRFWYWYYYRICANNLIKYDSSAIWKFWWLIYQSGKWDRGWYSIGHQGLFYINPFVCYSDRLLNTWVTRISKRTHWANAHIPLEKRYWSIIIMADAHTRSPTNIQTYGDKFIYDSLRNRSNELAFCCRCCCSLFSSFTNIYIYIDMFMFTA